MVFNSGDHGSPFFMKTKLLLVLGFSPVPLFAWEFDVSLIAGWGYEVDDSPKDMRELHEAKPPFVIGHVIGYLTTIYSNVEIAESRDFGIAFDMIDRRRICDYLSLTYGIGLDLKTVEIVYDIQHWNKFYGFNPFTMGWGGPPVLIGRADVAVDSFAAIPKVILGLSYDLGARWRLSAEGSVGLGYVAYEDYDFYNAIYQRARVIPPEQQIAHTNPSHDWIPQWQVELGLAYQVTETWSLQLAQGIVWQGNYELSNTVESNATIHGHTIQIENPWHLQTSLGASYAF